MKFLDALYSLLEQLPSEFVFLEVGDFPIGNGYYMNDYIMGMDI
jgi:hypothetical protein